MKLIVPCCGRSSRFPNLPPKWMLPSHDGRPMIRLATAELPVDADDLIVTCLREHEERFGVERALAEAYGRPIRLCLLPQPTASQADTVAQTLRAECLNEPFFVKDADNSFGLARLDSPENYVCVASLNDRDDVNARSKSYVRCDDAGWVTAIREKQVISDSFNVGGYFFTKPAQFLDYFARLSQTTNAAGAEIYLSHVIAAMLADGIRFRAQPASDYRDWGTLADWRRALLARRTYFASLDGFAFERGDRYFRPQFEDVRPHPAAVAEIRRLAEAGHRIVYLSIRPAAAAELTQRQIAAAQLPAGQVVYDCPIGRWTLVCAPDPTVPFAGCSSLELSPDDANLAARLEDRRD